MAKNKVTAVSVDTTRYFDEPEYSNVQIWFHRKRADGSTFCRGYQRAMWKSSTEQRERAIQRGNDLVGDYLVDDMGQV